jgi:hypothetical protein
MAAGTGIRAPGCKRAGPCAHRVQAMGDEAMAMSDATQYRESSLIGDDNFQVGRDGTVWRWLKRGPRRLHFYGEGQQGEWRQLKPMKSHGARHLPRVAIHSKKTIRCFSIARLVLDAFGVPRPICCEEFFKDGDRHNACLSNLAWAPRGTRHIGRKGGSLKGDQTSWSVLREEGVIEARELYRSGWSLLDLAQEMGMSRAAMYSALVGRNWKHVPNPIRAHEIHHKVLSNTVREGTTGGLT